MSFEPALEQNESQKPLTLLPSSTPVWANKLYGLFIVGMPIIAFWATDLFMPEWQDGDSNSYVILLLSPDASLIFFALIAFSIVCYILLFFDPLWFSQDFVVRFGIYTGVILTLQYALLSGYFFLFDNISYIFVLLPLWVLPIVVSKLYPWVTSRWNVRSLTIILIVISILGVIWSTVVTGVFLIPIVVLVAGVTLAAPFWIFLIYLQVAIWLFKNCEAKLSIPSGLGIVAWIAAYAFAWRYDILKMYELYAALPSQPPPDCYIATAAAQGHPRFVGSHPVRRADGLSMQVNGQLQRLKCAELALLAISPRLHKVLRRIYDVAGNALARRMTNLFVADIAYFLLKPAEWVAIFVLKWIVPDIESVSRRMYIS